MGRWCEGLLSQASRLTGETQDSELREVRRLSAQTPEIELSDRKMEAFKVAAAGNDSEENNEAKISSEYVDDKKAVSDIFPNPIDGSNY